MKCRLVKLTQLSGNRASIYSIVLNGESDTIFEKFLRAHRNSFKGETNDLLMRLNTIGTKTGAIASFFKSHEGKYGDGVCALYDSPGKKLRLYCIRYGTPLIIVGSGGPKSKKIRALQDDPLLKEENYFLRWLAEEIGKRIQNKEIEYINNYQDFDGNLEFVLPQ